MRNNAFTPKDSELTMEQIKMKVGSVASSKTSFVFPCNIISYPSESGVDPGSRSPAVKIIANPIRLYRIILSLSLSRSSKKESVRLAMKIRTKDITMFYSDNMKQTK